MWRAWSRPRWRASSGSGCNLQLRPLPGEVAEAEKLLDIDAMVRDAVDHIERIKIDP